MYDPTDPGRNPWWVAALVTALPVVFAAFLVWKYPPGPAYRAAGSPAPTAAVAR